MKIAIIQTIFGSIDEQHTHAKQNVACDFVLFNEQNTPRELPNEIKSERMIGKWIKMNLHKIFHEYDLLIYIDGTLQIKNKTFVEKIVNEMRDCEILFCAHTQRKCLYEHGEFVINAINNTQNEYHEHFKMRYDANEINDELEKYKILGHPMKTGLCFGGIFARKINADTNDFFETWSQFVFEHERVCDQIPLAYIMHEQKFISIKTLYDFFNREIIMHEHKLMK